MTSVDASGLAEPSIDGESWFVSKWRPAMAWLWFVVSACDFIIFPVLNAVAAGAGMIPYTPWEPLTLKGGGLFHISMGGVVGVATYMRSQEKLAVFNGPLGNGTVSSSTTTISSASKTTDTPSSRAD